MLTTGMPARSAFCATGVSASPSCGRTTSASGFCAIACSICWACESASAACSNSNLTSLCCAAAALAFLEIAPSQPWSVGGTLAMMRTVLPLVPFSVPAVCAAGACTVTVLVLSLLPHAASPSAESATTAVVMGSRMCDISCLLLLLVDLVPGLRALEQDRTQHDRALGDLLDLGGQVQLRHQAEDQRERQDPEERPDDRRPAAGQARAADHDGADRVQLIQVATDRRGAAEAGAQQHGRHARKQSRQHVDAEDDPPHRDAGDPRRLAVAAHRHDVAP